MGNQFLDSYEISTLRHEKTDAPVNYTSARVFRQGFGAKPIGFLTLRFTNSSVERHFAKHEFLIDVAISH